MKIQFTTSVAGARFAYHEGEKVELRDDIARSFVDAGQAVEVKADRPARRRGAQAAELATQQGVERR